MKLHLAIALAFVFVITGFGAGYWYHASKPITRAELEDYAVLNVLSILGLANLLKNGNTEELRDILDINLNDHLTRVRQYDGNMTDSAFLEAKIRALNAAALLWEERPPFKDKDWRRPNASNELWLNEWEDMTAKNIQMLKWAQKQCKDVPSIKCKSPNPPLEGAQ